jgi:hypothetical protein
MMRGLAGQVLDGCLAALGEAIQFRPAVGSTVDVFGIFDGPHEEVDPHTGAVISSAQFSVGVRLSDFPVEPVQGDKVFVREREYRVIDCRPDGQGGASLRLHET